MKMIYEEIEDETLAKCLVARQNPLIYPDAFVKFQPHGCILPRDYAKYHDSIRTMEVREDDVWVVSLPKSGTTWIQELVWLLGNNLDYEGAKTNLDDRFPFLEMDSIWKVKSPEDDKSSATCSNSTIEIMKAMKSPRFIKSHLPLNLLPEEIQTNVKRPKIIYIARNQKDLCVSLYHHRVLFDGYKGTLDESVDEFILDYTLYAPNWIHIAEFWDRRHEPNVHFVTYEAMNKDLLNSVRSVATFLGKSLTAPELDILLKHISFESMKSNTAVNWSEGTKYLTQIFGQANKTDFIRKGKVGSWKEELCENSIKKLDDWIAKNKIKGIWSDI